MSNPLFLPDLATMQQELRLSGVPAVGEDANIIIANALLTVRAGFYGRLGITRVGQLVAFTANIVNPSTNDEILRALARTVEVKWTFVVLMDRLPTLWMDDSGGAWQTYNEQGTFRKMSRTDMDAMRKRMMSEIDNDMAILSGEQTLGDTSGVNVGCYGSELDPRPLLSDTIFPPCDGDF